MIDNMMILLDNFELVNHVGEIRDIMLTFDNNVDCRPTLPPPHVEIDSLPRPNIIWPALPPNAGVQENGSLSCLHSVNRKMDFSTGRYRLWE